MSDYIHEYYDKIQDGTIVVGKWIKMLFDYLINGLNSKAFFLDDEKALEAITWIEEHCYHTEGPLAPQQFKMELWQKAALTAVYGIVDANGKRVFREILFIMGRKNGKSLFASSIAKKEWQDNGYGARVYCIAPKLDQTAIIYDSIWNQTLLDPEYQAMKEKVQAGIKYHERKAVDDSDLPKHRMTDLYIASTNSTVKKIAFSERKSDGFNPSLTICDEIAAWQGDRGLKQYEVMKSAMGAREMGQNPPLLISCSTSGYINDSIYDELIKRSTRFLMGESNEKRLLPFLYMIDDVEKWNDIEELKKANPNMGVSISEDYLLEEIAIAEGSLSKKAEFLCKYCNIKQNSSQAWLTAQTVNRCIGPALSLEDFRGHYCVGGIDLSMSVDLSSCCVVIEKDGELYVFSKFFLPAEKIQEATERDGLPYRIYIQRGILQPSGDNYVDYNDCFNWFRMLVEEYEILPLQVGYDRYNALQLTQMMEQYGFHMDSVYQGPNLSPVIREFEGLAKDGKIHIGDNDLLKVHFLDSALKLDAENSRVKLIKLAANAHIDGMAALLDAMCVRQKWYGEIGGQLVN